MKDALFIHSVPVVVISQSLVDVKSPVESKKLGKRAHRMAE